MRVLIVCSVIVVLLVATQCQFADAQGPGHGFGRGRGMQGVGEPHGHDERHDADHEVFQFLLENHSKIRRRVKELPDGVETLTESDDPQIAAKIKDHVEWMAYRIKEARPIRMRDPLFAELFRHTDKISMKHEDTEKGVKVVETSDDSYVAGLIKAHAKVVSKFVERGFAEAMKNHEIPGKSTTMRIEQPAPKIQDYGSVVQLPHASQQPRNGTKLVIDITRGGEEGKLNPAIEKVAKYINIYAAAGKEPATATFALVFHGDATLAVLNPDSYAAEFGTQGNPNSKLLMQLHEAGVEIYVCGQTLLAKGKGKHDVLVFVEIALSALTATVNLQSDGYAYVPLAN